MMVGLFTGAPGLPEVLIVLIALLLLFGGRKLPELARALGKSMSEFKKGRIEGERDEATLAESDRKTTDEDSPERGTESRS